MEKSFECGVCRSVTNSRLWDKQTSEYNKDTFVPIEEGVLDSRRHSYVCPKCFYVVSTLDIRGVEVEEEEVSENRETFLRYGDLEVVSEWLSHTENELHNFRDKVTGMAEALCSQFQRENQSFKFSISIDELDLDDFGMNGETRDVVKYHATVNIYQEDTK